MMITLVSKFVADVHELKRNSGELTRGGIQ